MLYSRSKLLCSFFHYGKNIRQSNWKTVLICSMLLSIFLKLDKEHNRVSAITLKIGERFGAVFVQRKK